MNIGVILCYAFNFTEEVYQKSSALHSFEKLYSQAMQLQVQVEHDLWGLLWPLYPHPRLSWPSFLGLVIDARLGCWRKHPHFGERDHHWCPKVAC